jgi:catechol O-methyltransferase
MPEPISLRAHLLKNLSLIALSLFSLPLTTTIVLICLLNQALLPYVLRRTSSDRIPGQRRQTILISSLAMGKGLALARAFHKAGQIVIGVDFDTTHFAACAVPSAGRFSTALERYYTVTTPHDPESREKYAEDMLRLVKSEGVDLWVCVSGVASTVEDALLKEKIERETRCKVFQPSPDTVEKLHDKNLFINAVKEAGLTVPTTVLVESQQEVFQVLREHPRLSFIVKCVELDDVSRADMTLLPQPTLQQTERFIKSLDISPKKGWVVQQFIRGKEYCTHAVVVRGKVKAFVACESSEMLMAYTPLPAESPLSMAMLAFTRRLAATLEDGKVTGQLSFDFLVDEKEAAADTPEEVMLYPIECNPRAHTAVVLLAQEPKLLADTYLSLLGEPGPPKPKADTRMNGETDGTDVSAVMKLGHRDSMSFYWVGHDLVASFVLPIVGMLVMGRGVLEGTSEVFWFAVRVLTWKDATFETWDPVPWWWLYQVYYPWMFVTSLATGKRWSRVNVSTTRVFESY